MENKYCTTCRSDKKSEKYVVYSFSADPHECENEWHETAPRKKQEYAKCGCPRWRYAKIVVVVKHRQSCPDRVKQRRKERASRAR